MNKEINFFYDKLVVREVLYYSKFRIVVLMLEYNCRFIMLGYVEYEVKIFYGRYIDLLVIVKIINLYKKLRIFKLDELIKSLYVWWRI